MAIREIRERMEGGFRPFTIFLTDGRKYITPRPEFILVGKYSVAILTQDGQIDGISPLDVVSVKDRKLTKGKPHNSH
jgi:hypothetical protein